MINERESFARAHDAYLNPPEPEEEEEETEVLMHVRMTVEWKGDLPEDMIEHFGNNPEEGILFLSGSEATLTIMDLERKKLLVSVGGEHEHTDK